MADKTNRRQFLKMAGAAGLGAGAASLMGTKALAAKKSIPKTPVKVAAISFLSGPAAGPFGIPGDNSYKMMADIYNKQGGILGRKIDLVSLDEAGGAKTQVELARKLILEDKVDVILGYISSGDCKAVMPLSDELGGLMLAYDCGTHVLMEGKKSPYKTPKYDLGFRTSAHLGQDNIALALAIKKYMPNVKKIAGINQDYAWGRDSWHIFELAIKKLLPKVEIVKTLWPKIFTTDFTAHISALQGSGAEIIHSSMWGGDAVTFLKQAKASGLFKQAKMALSRGEPYPQELGAEFPEGQFICCAGAHYFLYPSWDKWPLNKWFVAEFKKRYNKYPTYPSYHAFQAITAYKTAVEKASSLVGGWPTIEQTAKAMGNLSFETPSGYCVINKDHNAREDCLVGISKMTKDYPFPILDPDRLEVFPSFQVNAPAGLSTEEWIAGWKS
ncbi:MAG: ABC transporter substrate-binding protein [Desulfarculaceae bacterium]|nr:ABC transporter substrate-binding protein [Desulfarculaceae bacterium]MCF8074055.1 ABC transporter substrate-binding protein [Desulfarculaceae bacterium]MCF8102107.1 ABC transporter substrate-binding protein [Desulfarculaceae bacterium]MCF8117645.1 ABC transporter substrate-binding protein [Desulfarculaceae bacterium]